MADDLVITTQVDFELGTLGGSMDAEAVPGDLVLDGGNDGTYGSHALDGGVDWDNWGQVRATCTRPSGSVIRARFRTAATEGGLTTATWTAWFGCTALDQVIRVDLDTAFENLSITPGRWLEIGTEMRK